MNTRLLEAALTCAGVALLGGTAQSGWERRVFQHAPSGEPAVIQRMEIPRLSLNIKVLPSAGEQELKLGAGHVEGTAYPAITGNVVLAGHRDTVFRSLEMVRPGDLIHLTTKTGRFTYRVASTLITSPDNTQPLAPTDQARLTLVTCYPFRYVGPAPQRFVVRATLESFR